MSIEKTKLSFICKGKNMEEQLMVEANVIVPEGAKVLWVDADAVMDDALMGQSGQVKASVVFVNEDKQIGRVETNIPFLGKLALSDSAGAQNVIDASVVSAEFVRGAVQCVVALTVHSFAQEETEILCGGDDKFCIKTEEICAQELVLCAKEEFVEEISYPISGKMDNILSVTSRAVLKDVVAGDGMFSAVGEICTVIKYLTTTEDGQIVSNVNFVEPFRREVEVVGLSANGKVQARAVVDQMAFKYELDTETNKILIAVPLRMVFCAFEEVQMPHAVDVFGLECETKVSTQSFQKSAVLEEVFFEAKVDGTAVMDENSARIDKVVGASGVSVSIVSCQMTGENLSVSAVASFALSYLNDERGEILTERYQVPILQEFKAPELASADVSIYASLVDVDVAARRGREVILDGKLRVEVWAHKESVEAVISGIEEGAVYQEKQHAIEIYFGRQGDDLWDIAKELRVQPNLITLQNPDLMLPLEGAQNVVVYNARK